LASLAALKASFGRSHTGSEESIAAMDKASLPHLYMNAVLFVHMLLFIRFFTRERSCY